MAPHAPARLTRRGALAGAAGLLTGCAASSTPAPDAFAPVLDLALAQAATAVLVTVDGRVAAERYAPDWGPDRPREVASVAKSMVAVLLAVAVEDGAVAGFDQPAADFIPAWREDGRAAITLRHLMSMTSGLDSEGLALRGVEGDQFALNAAAPLRHPPGALWAYDTAAYHLLFHVLERAVGEPFEAWAGRRLLDALGMTHTRWITSRGAGAHGPVTNYYSAVSTARDLARFGALAVGDGAVDGRRLLSPARMRELVRPSQRLNPSYGLLWWSNARPGFDAFGRGPALRLPSAPRDAVAALGAGGQAVLAVPSRGLVLVRQGDPPPSAAFADQLLAAVLRAAP